MKTTMLFLVAFAIVNAISGQDTTNVLSSKKESEKEHKKELKEFKEQIEYQITKSIVDSRSYVLEANTLSNQWGNRRFVTSTLNFIAVDSLKAVIQIGSNTGFGYNGVGGITAEGNITSYKVEEDDKTKFITVTLSLMSNIGIYDILLQVSPNGTATATVSGLRNGKLIYDGDLVRKSQSHVYKGRSY